FLAEHASITSQVDEGVNAGGGAPSTGIVAQKRWYGGVDDTTKVGGNITRVVIEGSRQINPALSNSISFRRSSFSAMHSGGVFVASSDGSVHFLSENIQNTGRSFSATDPYDGANSGANYGVQQRLFSRNDGLTVAEY